MDIDFEIPAQRQQRKYPEIISPQASANRLNPVFTAQFHLNLYVEYWIELSYAIPLIGMLLPAGHLGDRYGRKNVFLAGMILFGGGSGLLTLMPTFESMFVARVIEGIGAACISANGGSSVS